MTADSRSPILCLEAQNPDDPSYPLDFKDLWTYLDSMGNPFDLGRFLGMYRAALVVPTSVSFQADAMEKMNLYYLMVRARHGD